MVKKYYILGIVFFFCAMMVLAISPNTDTTISLTQYTLNPNTDSTIEFNPTTCTPTQVMFNNSNANLDMELQIPGANNAGNIEFLTTTCTNVTPPSTSSCVWSGTGTHNINCSEFCTVSNNYNYGGNIVNLLGNGEINITSNLSNFNMKFNTSNTCRVNLKGAKLT